MPSAEAFGTITAFAFDPARPARVLAASDAFVMLVSTDSGGSWHAAPDPDGTPVYCLATTPRIPLPSDPVDPPSDLADTRYFPTTGHSLAAPFLAYWRAHEGSALIGPPISEPLSEQTGDGTGRRYLVQYFRDMRLEYHPELQGTPYVVAPGVIGRQYLHERGWI